MIEREAASASSAAPGCTGRRSKAIPATELAWTTEPAFQGRGFATEAARAAMELAAQVGLEEVVAMALPENAASRRVAEKIGMAGGRRDLHAGSARTSSTGCR